MRSCVIYECHLQVSKSFKEDLIIVSSKLVIFVRKKRALPASGWNIAQRMVNSYTQYVQFRERKCSNGWATYNVLQSGSMMVKQIFR